MNYKNNLNAETHLNRYYLMRHGESHANKNGIIVSSAKNALNAYGLTERGADQAMQAALNTRLDRHTLIVSSDYLRASETANIVHSVVACDTPIAHSTLLRERAFGEWELSDHKNYENVWQNDLKKPNNSLSGVETVTETLQRTLLLISQLEKKHSNKTILLVGHGDVLQILLAHHHNINPRFHRSLSSIANADIRTLSKLDLNTKRAVV